MTSVVISKPLAIGATDLMRAVQCSYSGTLHIRVKAFLGKKKWQPRYVVISQGCLYVYEDKNAKHTESSYTIKKFESVIQLEEDGDESFCFCVKYEIPTNKPLVFACDTDVSRKVWLRQFESTIQDVQNFSADSGFGSSAGSISATEIDRLRMQDLKLDTEEKGYEEIEDLQINYTESQPVQASNDAREASYAKSTVLHPHNLTATTNQCDELLYENITANTTQTGNSLSVQLNSNSLLSVRGGSEQSDTMQLMSNTTSLLSVRAGSEHSDTYTLMSNATAASKPIRSMDYISVRTNEDAYPNTETKPNDETLLKTVRSTGALEISSTKTPVSPLRVSVMNRLENAGDEDSDNSCNSDNTFESPVEDIDMIYVNTKIPDEAEYYCSSKMEAKRNMKGKPQGAFLICPGTATQWDLCVKTAHGTGWFHIYKQTGQFSLFKHVSSAPVVFPTIDALLHYYHIHDLPSKNFELKLAGIFPALSL